MDIQFGIQPEDRSAYKLARVRCQNLFAEQAASVPDRPVALLSCPGIESYSTLGGSACTGLARQDGVFNGDIFAVSTNTLYRVNSSATASSIGSVGTDGDLSRFAFIRPTSTATQGYVATLASVAGTVYLYDNSTLTTISDVDVGSSVRDVASINGRLVFATGDDEFVWSEVLDPSNVDALSFATAERSPDDLKAILISQQEVWLMGSDTIEVWVDSGGFDVFVPIAGGFIERGLLSRDLATTEDNTVFWVGNDRVIYRANGYLPTRVSTHYIAQVMQGLSDADLPLCKMSSYTQDGHKFVQVRTPNSGTFVLDISTNAWHERDSEGQTTYRALDYVERGGVIIMADAYAGNLRNFNTAIYQDMGEEIVRLATAITPVRSNVPAFSLALDCAKGVGISTGQGSDPFIILRFSDDNGNTWSNEYTRSVGKIGEYGKRVIWRQMGRMKPPNRIWEIRFTDKNIATILGARLNDMQS